MFRPTRWVTSLSISALIALYAGPVAAQTAAAPAAPATSTSPAAPGSAGATTTSRSTPVGDEYKLRPGDLLKVTVWGHADLSLDGVPVRPDGKISYPTIGDIYVVDQTPAQLGRIIALGLRKYLNNPNVSVTLLSSATEKYFVTGSVNSPGSFSLTAGMGVREAVIASGDLAQDANDQTAILLRDGKTIKIDLAAAMAGDADKNILLKPGDTLSIDRALVYYQGELNTTGQMPLRRGSTLTQALAAAGGHRESADIERVQILRGDQILFANLREIAVDHGKDITLRPGDIIKVDSTDERTVPVFITGAVSRQGLYRFLPGRRDTLENAINWAGGAAQGADLKRVKVRRTDEEGNTTEAAYDLRSVEGRSIQLQPNDYIEVPRAKKKTSMTTILSSSVGLVLGILGISRSFR